MDETKKEDIKETVVTPPSEVTTEQDPLKTELDRVQKSGRTPKEKLLYTKARVEKQLKELDGEDVTPEIIEEDDKPVTVGMLKKIQQQTAVKTALQLTDDIQNDTERELVKFHLENTIKSTGTPSEDLRNARAIVNASKNAQILEEVSRKSPSKTHSSGSSAPAKTEEPQELTKEEIMFTRPPFNMKPADIIKARK